MDKSFYIQNYYVTRQRWAEGCGDRDWLEWITEIKKSFKWCVDGMLTQLDREDVEIWFTLGLAYSCGNGVERDKAQAEFYLRKAAETGHLKAMTSLGSLLRHHEITEEQNNESIWWYQKAADLGAVDGMIMLGFTYRDKYGSEADLEKALQWFMKAVEHGDQHSMIHVARMYAGWLNKPAEAVRWFNQAAEAGFSESHIGLAMLYDDRKSPVYSPVDAVKWYHAVVDGTGGSKARAMMALARHYRDGSGVDRSPKIALDWLDQLLKIVPEKTAMRREAMELIEEIKGSLL